MTIPTTSQGIYDLLEDDATLASLLGTYLLPGATGTIPALARLMPLEDRPPGLVIRGVEVLILRFPSGQASPFSTGGEEVSGQFQLYATQWTPSTSNGAYHVETVAQRIAQLLPGATWTANTPPDGLGGLAQLAISWSNPELSIRWSDD